MNDDVYYLVHVNVNDDDAIFDHENEIEMNDEYFALELLKQDKLSKSNILNLPGSSLAIILLSKD